MNCLSNWVLAGSVAPGTGPSACVPGRRQRAQPRGELFLTPASKGEVPPPSSGPVPSKAQNRKRSVWMVDYSYIFIFHLSFSYLFLTVISILKEKFTVICYISVNSDFSYWKREKMSLSESLSTWMIIYYKIRNYLWHREEQWHDLIFCQNHVSQFGQLGQFYVNINII